MTQGLFFSGLGVAYSRREQESMASACYLSSRALTMIRAKCQSPGTSVERYNEVQNDNEVTFLIRQNKLCHIFSSITLQTLIQGQCH